MRITVLLFFLGNLIQLYAQNELSIYFKNDSDEILSRYKRSIDSLKTTHTKDSIVIDVKGYANAYAGNTYNLELSQRRIESVKKLLNEYIFVKAIAIGELDSYSWRDRRVDIKFSVIPKAVAPLIVKKDTLKEGNKRRMLLSTRNLDIISYRELDINEKTVLFGIFFKGGTDIMLGNSSKVTLKKLLDFMNDYPTRKIKLTGHICCRLFMGMNLNPKEDGENTRTGTKRLSVDRAFAVYSYLIKNGINKDRLVYEGKAYLEPLDWEEIKNRRVEVTIVE